jgi:ketol-acid reductoisomerase
LGATGPFLLVFSNQFSRMDINTKILDTLEKSMDKIVTDKKTGKFMIECCDHVWYRKFDYERHLKSKKHAQMRKIIGQMRNSVGVLHENAQKEDI